RAMAVSSSHFGQRGLCLSGDPDLLARPSSSPLGIDDVVPWLRAGRRPNLDESLDGEPTRPELRDPFTVRRVELDTVVCAVLRPVTLEVVPYERSAGLVAGLRRARSHH